MILADVLVTDDEVKKVRDSAIRVNFHSIITGKILRIPVPVRVMLKSGYSLGMSIDEYPVSMYDDTIGSIVEHLSIGGVRGRPDAADSDIIAKAILSDGFKYIGTFYNDNAVHYMKPLNEKAANLVDMIIKNKKEFL